MHTRTRGSRAHVASQVQSKSGVAHVDRLRHCRVQPNKHTYILTHLREAKELHSQHICTLRNERVSKRLKSSTEEGSSVDCTSPERQALVTRVNPEMTGLHIWTVYEGAKQNTHTLIQSLTHSLTKSLTRSLTGSVSRQSLTCSLVDSTHSLIHSLTHSITDSLVHSFTHSLPHTLTYLLTHSLTDRQTHKHKSTPAQKYTYTQEHKDTGTTRSCRCNIGPKKLSTSAR